MLVQRDYLLAAGEGLYEFYRKRRPTMMEVIITLLAVVGIGMLLCMILDIYELVTGIDVADTSLALEGAVLPDAQEQKKSVLEPRACLNCGEPNGPEAVYCIRCGTPLTEAEANRVMSMERAARTKMEALEMRLAKLEQERKNQK